jgi:hypothetical protein
MAIKKNISLKLTRPDWHTPVWWKVAYLIIGPGGIREFEKIINIRPTDRFRDLVEKHVVAYLEDDILPPKEISPAILNIADQYAEHGSAEIRTGDYITLQNYLMQHKA